MPDTVNIGFIGCGGNARGHIRRVLKIPGAKIVGVCDLVEDLAQSAAQETGAISYTDHRQLLDRGDLHGVYLSLPVFAHGQPELDAIERKIPFLVEKPVGLEMGLVREIAARVKEQDLLTVVGYQLRYAGTVDLAREILRTQRIGLVVGKYWCNSGAGSPSFWMRQMAKSGGQLVEQATHTIDMMRYLIGEIVEVYCAATQQVLNQIDCPDFQAAALRFENGAVGSLSTSWASDIGWNNANVLDILYEDKMLHWTYGSLSVTRPDGVQEFTKPGGDIDEVFIQALKTGDRTPIRSSYSDAVLSLAVSLAMNLSAREGRPVKVEEILAGSA